MKFKVPVFFDERMVCHSNISFSPSAGKPLLTMYEWRELFSGQISVHNFLPVSDAVISLAHDLVFVRDILSCSELNGFGNRLPEVAASLPYTSGAMLAAAREALANKKVAVAPVSGFHHAGYDSSGGFCTFNGLMITAQWALRTGVVKRVGILDLDQHYGNGTDHIIRTLGLKKNVMHFSAGKHNQIAEKFLAKLPALIEALYRDCDVLLYQAGADPHIDDPLGGWMTTEQLKRRDELVFATCATMNLPVAWNLAGGYQDPLQKVLDIHNNTMAACIEVYGND